MRKSEAIVKLICIFHKRAICCTKCVVYFKDVINLIPRKIYAEK